MNLLELPSDILGLIFNKLETIGEIKLHHCISKSWNEIYWASITSIYINSTVSLLEDRHLINILRRVNPLRLYSLDLFKKAPKLTIDSLSLLTQLINLKFLRLNDVKPDLLVQTLTSLVSLRDLDFRSTIIDEDFMNMIADHLTKLTKILCAQSEKLYRWSNAYKLTKLKELTVALTKNFSADGFRDLAKLSNLTFLNVNANSNINNDSLSAIFSMTNLETLFCSDAKVTLPRAYSGLASMTKLQRLNAHILTDEETLSYLSQAYALISLGFSGRTSDDHEISAKFISTLTNLKVLLGIKMTDTQLLTTLTNLEKLDIFQQTIAEEFPLQVMTNLTLLIAKEFNGKALQKVPYLTKLESMRFKKINSSLENDFENINYCEKLRSLSYFGAKLTEKQFGYIVQCTQLQELFIGAPSTCADEFSKLTQLRSLELRSGDWDMEKLKKLTILTQLTSLRVCDNKKLSSDQQTAIQNLFGPNVRTKLIVYVYKMTGDDTY